MSEWQSGTEGSFPVYQEEDRFMVLSFLDRQPVGTMFEGSLPAHLTYAARFALPEEYYNDLTLKLRDITTENRAPQITGGSQVVYGQGEAARRIEIGTDGFNLLQDYVAKAQIARFLEEMDDPFLGNEQHAQRRVLWSPIVMDTPDRALRQGETVSLDNLTLVRRESKFGRKIIEQVHAWGK